MIYNVRAAQLLLGTLLNNPQILFNEKYNLSKEDFQIDYHKSLFNIIQYLSKQGSKNITPVEIDNVLTDKKSIKARKILEDNDYIQSVPIFKDLSDENNIDAYYNDVKRCSLLRFYQSNGFDISKFENSDDGIDDIIGYFEGILVQSQREYKQENDDTKRKKAGDNGKNILENFEKNPVMGLSFESKYLTTLWGGWRKKQLYIRSGDTSSGKSRSSLGDLACVCAPYIFNSEKQEWIKNPNGKNKGLYIGAEMELDEEVDPLLWAYMANVNSADIIEGHLTSDEKERVEKAIEYLNNDCIWLADMPSFNIQKLNNEIKEHKRRYNIDFVVFDYMLISNELTKEFNKGRTGMASRGDEVLMELSKKLKDIAKRYDIGLLTATQTNADIKDYRNRDYQVIRGGKAVADEATGGSISMPITLAELELVRPYFENNKFGLNQPNFVETVYKSRFSRYPKECKIFSYYDLGTLRKKEMFVTDKNFMPIDIKQTIINKIEE